MMPVGVCGAYRCQLCRGHDGKIDRQLTLWRYESPLDSVIHGLKFNKMEFLGSQLAAALHRKFSPELSEINMVVPIPLHWYRRLGRGYNQAEAIGLPLGKSLGTPMVRALRRKRPTRAQARLERNERLGNLVAALIPTSDGLRELRGSQVLLVDDVMTTGATLSAATRCLDSCGVKSVTTVTVASTPLGASQKKSQMVANVEDRGFRGF
jgi:ComF family protein